MGDDNLGPVAWNGTGLIRGRFGNDSVDSELPFTTEVADWSDIQTRLFEGHKWLVHLTTVNHDSSPGPPNGLVGLRRGRRGRLFDLYRRCCIYLDYFKASSTS